MGEVHYAPLDGDDDHEVQIEANDEDGIVALVVTQIGDDGDPVADMTLAVSNKGHVTGLREAFMKALDELERML